MDSLAVIKSPLISLLLVLIVNGCSRNSNQLADTVPQNANHIFKPWFVDVIKQSGIDFKNLNGDPAQIPIIDQNGQGAAFFDYNNDGWMDLYLISGSTIKLWKKRKNPGNRLYRNNGDGTFRDVTREAGVQGNRWSNGCAAADYDGDGFVDLFVTNWGPNTFYHNNGDGTFTDVTEQAGLGDSRWASSAAFGDVDNDGDLDLYVANYVKFDPDHFPTREQDGSDCLYKGIRTGCGPWLYEGEQDILYLNNGDGTFTEVTQKAGLQATRGYRSFGTVLIDFDLDNDLDLYVGCDVMPNLYFLNQGSGKFFSAGRSRGGTLNATGKHESGMGVAVGDVNDDGFPDVFTTNFAGETNTLYLNSRGFFEDVTEKAGLDKHPEELGWGNYMADFDNDGFLDILVVNGHIYPQVTQLKTESYTQPWRMFKGLGNGKFIEAGDNEGWHFKPRYSSRGAAVADYDNDGDLDILVVNHNDRPTLLRNQRGGNFLTISLIGDGKNPQAIGARIAIKFSDRTIWRYLTPHQGYQSSHDPRVHFGLGAAQKVNQITIYWPGGEVETIKGPIQGNQFITIKKGEGIL